MIIREEPHRPTDRSVRPDDDHQSIPGQPGDGPIQQWCSAEVGGQLVRPVPPRSPTSEHDRDAGGRDLTQFSPSASRIGTSLALDSANSSSGSEPATMPQPA